VRYAIDKGNAGITAIAEFIDMAIKILMHRNLA